MTVRLRDWSPIALEATICELILGQLYRVQEATDRTSFKDFESAVNAVWINRCLVFCNNVKFIERQKSDCTLRMKL